MEVSCLENRSGMKGFFYNFKKYLPLLRNLAGKDFKIKYRRSVLGVAWSILNPLLTMLVLTAVFSMIFKVRDYPDIGDFAVYYIVGASIWNFFAEATSSSLTSILGSAGLIKKVYIPKYIFPLEKSLFSLINFALSLIAVAIVMAFRMSNINPGWTIVLFPIPVFYCLLFVIGMSLILSAVSVYFQDVIHLYGVVLTLWMYLTPLIYPESLLDSYNKDSALQTVAVAIVRYNPMTKYIQYFRDVVIYNTLPSLTDNLMCLGYGLLFLVIGIFTFNKLQKKFILHI